MALTMNMPGVPGRASSAVVAAPGVQDRLRAFRQSRRHSLLVRLLQTMLPLAAVTLLVAYGIALQSSWRIGQGRLNVGKLEITADDLTMKNPSYFGVMKDGGRYEVRAKRAMVDFAQSQPTKLFDIDGDLIQPTGVKTKLWAKQGLLDNKTNELELFNGIDIAATNGMKAKLSRATVYTKAQRVISREPVQAEMPTGSVKAKTMTLNTNSHEASFRGSVETRLIQTGEGRGTAGFQLGRDGKQPIDVHSDELDVNDTAKVAQFRSKVVAIQGEAVLKCAELTVTYQGQADASAPAAGAPTEPASRLTRLLGNTNVTIDSGTDRHITSDHVDFDAIADTALFTGNVVVNQEKNILRGRRLLVDRKSGKSRLDAPADAGQAVGRITSVFDQNESKASAAKSKPPPMETESPEASGLLGTFKTDPHAPIEVESDTLDVNDPIKLAIFKGNVRAKQGDFLVRTAELQATYSGQMGLNAENSAGDLAGKQGAELTRVEAKQKVVITGKDGQTATGDWASFDVKANTVLMGGRVIVSREKDFVEGTRLRMDLTSGQTFFERDAAAPPPLSAVVRPDGRTATTPPVQAVGNCPPGRSCLLLYPKDAKDRLKKEGEKTGQEGAHPVDVKKGTQSGSVGDGWQSTISPSRQAN
jgi:LPS export ABC transporter protein LptC/lipopolysaccharide transport protein LptA